MSLSSIAARRGVARSDADGFDRDEPELRAAVIAELHRFIEEKSEIVKRLSPASECPNIFKGELRAAETAIRFARVDLAELAPKDKIAAA